MPLNFHPASTLRLLQNICLQAAGKYLQMPGTTAIFIAIPAIHLLILNNMKRYFISPLLKVIKIHCSIISTWHVIKFTWVLNLQFLLQTIFHYNSIRGGHGNGCRILQHHFISLAGCITNHLPNPAIVIFWIPPLQS